MAGSVNKVILIGNLGKDPEARAMQNGAKVVSFNMATGESWTDKASGERKERTQWHRVVVFNEKIAEVAERYLKKGQKVYVEGQLESRKYTDKDGLEREITEVVLRQFRGEMTMLTSANDGGGGGGGYSSSSTTSRPAASKPAAAGGKPAWEPSGDLDDEIPF